MRGRSSLAIVLLVLGLPALGLASDRPAITGEYAEARTCDVWTGPCFANGEVNLKGDHAVLAWAIAKGEHDGVGLDGLRVVASIDAEGTLGSDVEGVVRAVIFVDERATKAQAGALVDLVKTLAPAYTKKIVATHREKITFERRGMSVAVSVGKKPVVEIETAPLMAHCDTICGNETAYYPSLAKATGTECAKAVAHAYRGADLGVSWSHPNARSAIIGKFEL